MEERTLADITFAFEDPDGTESEGTISPLIYIFGQRCPRSVVEG